jgi:hypothetical protein
LEVTPHTGDRFRRKNGTEIEATGAVFSVTKRGVHTPCLYVSRIVDGGRQPGNLDDRRVQEHHQVVTTPSRPTLELDVALY